MQPKEGSQTHPYMSHTPALSTWFYLMDKTMDQLHVWEFMLNLNTYSSLKHLSINITFSSVDRKLQPFILSHVLDCSGLAPPNMLQAIQERFKTRRKASKATRWTLQGTHILVWRWNILSNVYIHGFHEVKIVSLDRGFSATKGIKHTVRANRQA